MFRSWSPDIYLRCQYILLVSCFISTLSTTHFQHVEVKRDINQQNHKIVEFHFVNFETFAPMEVVARVSGTQLQVDENSNQIIWRLNVG